MTQSFLFNTAGPAAHQPHVEAIINTPPAPKPKPKPKPKPGPPAEDAARLSGNRLRIVEHLRKGPAFNYYLCKPDVGGMRFGARIDELRELGFDIETSRRDGGVFVYELIAEPKKA